MTKKTFKLFGIKIFEIISYEKENEILLNEPPKKPQGEVLELTPEEYQKFKDKETIKKMEGK